ncbi:MAG: hypothetical protein GF419_02745 [Ignavibacteriales bacterium]|nr:hypothetical protein [Ignavibacteriales bacterium]
MADSAAREVATRLDEGESYRLSLALPGEYVVFGDRLLATFIEEAGAPTDSGETTITLTITRASVLYGEPERESLFSPYRVPRELFLSGSFAVVRSEETVVEEFARVYRDAVRRDSLAEAATPGVAFTDSPAPPEPLFSSLLEPVAVIGASAAAVWLFFTVRNE